MSGVGFAGSGKSSFENNRSLLKNRRKPFNKDKMPNELTHYHGAFRDKPASKIILMNIRRRIQENSRRETIRLMLVLITAAGICLILILLVARYFN